MRASGQAGGCGYMRVCMHRLIACLPPLDRAVFARAVRLFFVELQVQQLLDLHVCTHIFKRKHMYTRTSAAHATTHACTKLAHTSAHTRWHAQMYESFARSPQRHHARTQACLLVHTRMCARAHTGRTPTHDGLMHPRMMGACMHGGRHPSSEENIERHPTAEPAASVVNL